MTIALYEISVPVFRHGLNTLHRILDKAAAQANQRGYPLELLLHSRFYPDMYPLSRQLERLSQIPLESCSVLTRQPLTPFAFADADFSQYQQGLQHSLTQLDQLQPDAFVAATVQPVVSELAGETQHFVDGLHYLLQQAQPNFYFHLTTAYNLLRHNGVQLGKLDFLGYQAAR
ncbi:DUF1993 domain-containing protein [Rheinheimera texasensis]|uniref:DUF1993 domain-containing protein n=1 Tax=Rheinheimera texasensis TaxID=306205 RepID=UPI0032B10B38